MLAVISAPLLGARAAVAGKVQGPKARAAKAVRAAPEASIPKGQCTQNRVRDARGVVSHLCRAHWARRGRGRGHSWRP
jgi:hypothetical protein